VGGVGVIVLSFFFTLNMLGLLYGIRHYWPRPMAVEGPPSPTSADLDLLLLAVLVGALGSATFSLHSLCTYYGHGMLMWRWVPFLMLRPFVGGALAALFYLVVRGGLLVLLCYVLIFLIGWL
jgi:hypothetical protein